MSRFLLTSTGQLQQGLQRLMEGGRTPLLAWVIVARLLEWTLAGRLAEVAHARAMHARASSQQGHAATPSSGGASKWGAAILEELGKDPVSDILSEVRWL
jgi:hypothetical protein